MMLAIVQLILSIGGNMTIKHNHPIEPNILKALDTYNNGKFQRLNLLFAVNGGALLIAQFMFGDGSSPASAGLGPPDPAFGDLILSQLALGAIFLTVLIIFDTRIWAQRMKDTFIRGLGFSTGGKVLLLAFGLLNIIAWALVGFL
jgi:hypothetical protein